MKQRPWLFLIPALVLMSLNAFIPLMTVVNYSLHYKFAGTDAVFVGMENYIEVLHDPNFRGALLRQFGFTTAILLIEFPLGMLVALALPKRGRMSSVCLVLLGIPLLIPFNVVGIVWRLFTQSNVGVIPVALSKFGYEYNVALEPVDAALTLVLLDVWHWTPLVALLCYAGLQAIPPAWYQAAAIDGASTWNTFRYVTLPKLKPVLIIGVLLRFMDSFKIYSEPLLLTGGGPGNATTFLNLFVARKAESGEFGYSGAASVLYLYLVILLSFIFFQAMTQKADDTPDQGNA